MVTVPVAVPLGRRVTVKLPVILSGFAVPVTDQAETFEDVTLLAVIVKLPLAVRTIVTGPNNAEEPVSVKPFIFRVPVRVRGGGAVSPKTLPPSTILATARRLVASPEIVTIELPLLPNVLLVQLPL